ncbi:hypothetical protein L596_002560 [Steinernema carpocapsae]|uniref:Protein quiver n=1 Tax=Steinernema carpocapsae TaxID=34508 RepID=A0A4V6I7Q8_STECR|nr:hypothetical protein L596_002560 [Steinernema carpocapsae]
MMRVDYVNPIMALFMQPLPIHTLFEDKHFFAFLGSLHGGPIVLSAFRIPSDSLILLRAGSQVGVYPKPTNIYATPLFPPPNSSSLPQAPERATFPARFLLFKIYTFRACDSRTNSLKLSSFCRSGGNETRENAVGRCGRRRGINTTICTVDAWFSAYLMKQTFQSTLALLLMVLVQEIYGRIRTNRCYSCMSPLYEELFREGIMSRYFYEPKNFTSQCDDPMNPEMIGMVPCRTICLTLTQDFVVMGRKTGRRLTMRGCSTSLNRLGFFNRTIAMFDRYDICRDVKVSDLFRYETETSSSREIVHVCSCLGDRCNAATAGSIRRSAAFSLSAVVIATFLVHNCLFS